MNMLMNPRERLHLEPGLVEFGFALAAIACAVVTGALLLYALAAF